MSINIGPPSVEELRPRIAVIGVGGAGGNAVANMIQAEIEGVDFIVANTDAQALNNSVAEHRIQLGPDITRGLGAGSRPEVGRAAAEETVEDIERALDFGKVTTLPNHYQLSLDSIDTAKPLLDLDKDAPVLRGLFDLQAELIGTTRTAKGGLLGRLLARK